MTDVPLPEGGPPQDQKGDLAAELALGVLDGDARAAAERRMLADPHFAREVEGWSLRFARIAEEAPAKAPPARLWSRIDVAVADMPSATANVIELRLRRSLTVWRSVAGAAGAIAAGLVVVLALPRGGPPATQQAPIGPVVAQQASGAVLEAASLSSAKGGKVAFIAVYDPDRRELVLTPASLGATPGRSPELWIIPAGQAPISLGVGQFGKPVRLKVDALSGKDGGTLAVSLEPEGGSPTGKPTGPILATGQLQAL